jgi:hypothetical protein
MYLDSVKFFPLYHMSLHDSVMTCARISVLHYNLSPRESVMTCARISVLHYIIKKNTLTPQNPFDKMSNAAAVLAQAGILRKHTWSR